MKKYVILTGTITRMGGAQMYVSNKNKYMTTQGWKVYIYSGLEGPIIINTVIEHKNRIWPILDVFPNMLRRSEVKRCIDAIVKDIDYTEDDEIMIESNTSHMACWGELLAKRINAKNFVFLLDEFFHFDKGYVDFFRFKFDRHELALINAKLFSALFGENCTIAVPENYTLRASCNNVVEDITDSRLDSLDFSGFDYTICSLGRLNKRYIPNVIEGFKRFANSHRDKKIAYIFIGDQPKEFKPDMMQVIKTEFDKMENVSVYLLGYVFPIPTSFFRYLDVGVASSGSCRVLWHQNVKTISIDANDFEPIGVLGYTTFNSLYRSDEDRYSLDDLLHKVLETDYLSSFSFTPSGSLSYDDSFSKHLQFIDKMSEGRDYYDILNIRLDDEKNRAKKLVVSSLGFNGYNRLRKAKLFINRK